MSDEWARWLARSWEWDWFFTGTFARMDGEVHDQVGWSLSDRLFRDWIAAQDEKAVGAGVYWLRAREPHQFTQATHFHALVGGVAKLSRRDAWASWFRVNGQARVDPIPPGQERRECITRYVSKYVLKSAGEVVFSPNAGLFVKEN